MDEEWVDIMASQGEGEEQHVQRCVTNPSQTLLCGAVGCLTHTHTPDLFLHDSGILSWSVGLDFDVYIGHGRGKGGGGGGEKKKKKNSQGCCPGGGGGGGGGGPFPMGS